ncbi:MAG: FixH family protein [Paludibacter sp.]
MKTLFSKMLYILAISAIFASCKNEVDITPVNPLEGLTKLQEGYALGASAKVQIWGKKNFFMGYNMLKVVLLDSLSNDTIKDAQIEFMPVMTMPQAVGMPMVHACPVENPNRVAQNGTFSSVVAFVMPSMGGSWKLSVMVKKNNTSKSGIAAFDIIVDNPSPVVMSVFTATSTDASKLVLSLVEPVAPKVGMNDIEFTLHRKETMMSWPADSTYTFVITPEMPSMGHGSPNNVNPVHVGNGHYKGKVNFTMTGEWKVNVAVQKDGNTISNNAYFTITF